MNEIDLHLPNPEDDQAQMSIENQLTTIDERITGNKK